MLFCTAQQGVISENPILPFDISFTEHLFFSYNLCYTKIAALLHSILWRKEVSVMHDFLSFLLSVAAGVIANCISKWLDEWDKDSKH